MKDPLSTIADGETELAETDTPAERKPGKAKGRAKSVRSSYSFNRMSVGGPYRVTVPVRSVPECPEHLKKPLKPPGSTRSK